MTPAERFLEEAAECERMYKLSHSRTNKGVWRRMAERWRHCAEVVERQTARGAPKQTRNRTRLIDAGPH